MRIESMHIDGFGVWTDRTWTDLHPGLNVFHGSNEAGKSTLMSFVRSILFGFDRRGSPKRYEPLNGGTHGGRIEFAVGDRRVRIERKAGRHVRGTVLVYEGDNAASEEALDKLLGGTTRTLYHNIFAFGLEELEQFHTLQESEVATHISGAGLGIGAARWTAVQKDLEERQGAMFLPRGQNSTINVAFRELEAVRDDIDRTEHQPQDYWTAHEARTRLTSELAALEDTVTELRRGIDFYEKRRNARPLIERREKLQARLRELPAVETFPEGGIERLNLFAQQIKNLESELARKAREKEERRLRRIELHSLADPQEIARRKQVIETLRTLSPRVDAVRRIYSACTQRCDAIVQEKETLQAALDAARPPSKVAFIVFLALIWAGATGAFLAGHAYVSIAVFVVSLQPLFWYGRRRRMAQTLEIKTAECGERSESCSAERKKTEDEARQIESEIHKLIGQVEITPQDIDTRVSELERLAKYGDEIRELDEASAQAETEVRMIDHQIEETRRSISELLAEASAANETEFIERSEIFKQRLQVLNEIEKIPLEESESGFLFDLRAEEDAAYRAAELELAEAEKRLIDARHETGRVDERIATMERSEDRARALSKQETILARIDVAAEQWAVLTLCRAMLDETRKIYETERQPEVLCHASSFFGVMTEGRYRRVLTPVDSTDIQVERGDGVRLAPQLLSRGTAEQLYLAMRLALVREYARHIEPLPVVLDDILVNFDPERTRSTIRAVRELCSSHQVLLFTCHPHLVQIVGEIVPDAKVFSLQ